jgi:hypothetical protein
MGDMDISLRRSHATTFDRHRLESFSEAFSTTPEMNEMLNTMEKTLQDSANENKVFMSFKVHAISELDIVKGTVIMDGTLYVYWNVSVNISIRY